MKEKAKVAPKQLVRRGLDDGTERLRGQLRETAQRGQASDYGGDRIEDTVARGAYQARRGVESLLKEKKSAKGREADGEPRTAEDPSTQAPPADPPPPEVPGEQPSPHELPPRERPRIKTQEAVSAREGGANAGPSDSGRAGPSPGERMKRAQIKTRESAVHDDPRPDVQPAPQAGSKPPQIRTRESTAREIPADAGSAPQVRSELPKIKTRSAVTSAPSGGSTAPPADHRPGTPDRLSIKTKDAYIQRQPAEAPEQPPQAFTQGQQGFAKEQGRRAAVKRAEAQRLGNGSVPQGKGSGNTAPSVPVQRGHASSGRGYAPAHPVRQPVSPGNPDTRPVQKSGKTIVKTARSARKVPERTARHAIKTAERSSRKAIKTTQRTAKTAQQTVKTAQRSAQATVKATQRAVQTARATAKAAAVTAKATAKATVAAIKAAIAAMQELIAAIAAGGWVVIVVVLVICMIGLLIASPFGIFFSDGGGSPDAASPTAVIAQINSEYADRLSALQTGGTRDKKPRRTPGGLGALRGGPQ